MVTRFEITNGRIAPSEQERSPVLVFTNPDDVEKKYLIEKLKIDEHTLASALDPDELSQIKHNRNYYDAERSIWLLK
jgi:magnesium transporter